MSKTTFTVADDKKTLLVERTFPAPKDKVWKAYSTAELLAKWWGPRGWTTQVTHLEFVDGGFWHYGMTCQDPAMGDWFGKTSWGKSVYRNIRPTDSFEYTDYFCDEHGTVVQGMPASSTLIQFIAAGNATKVTFRTVYETPEALAQVLNMGMQQGFDETLDRLEEFLVG